MSKRYKGALLSATPPTTTGGTTGSGSAGGVWTLQQEMQAKGNNAWPESTNYIEECFSTYVYAGDGAAPKSFTNGIDLANKGGLLWIKQRGGAESHALFDTARGRAYSISTDANTAQTGPSSSGADLSSFNSDGFTTGTTSNWALNFSGRTYSSWAFRKQAKFFDVVTYTGDGAATRTISHSLGAAPGCIIAKAASLGGGAYGSWTVYHREAGTGSLFLDLTNAYTPGSSAWQNTAPTSSVFYVDSNLNQSGATYVVYLFAHDAGGFGLTGTDNVVSCGSFSISSGVDSTINLGYEPQWLLIKKSTAASDWRVIDNMRGMAVSTSSSDDANLYPNTSVAEALGNVLSPTSTGFVVPTTSTIFDVGSTYIYVAIRRGPMKTPTDGTKVFSPVARTGTGANVTVSSGFTADSALTYNRGGTNPIIASRLTRNGYLATPSTAAEVAAGTTIYQANPWDVMDGIKLGSTSGLTNASANTFINYFFKRSPGFFDEVCCVATATSDQAHPHNLGVEPELIIAKDRTNAGPNWAVYSKDLGKSKYLSLNNTNAAATSTNIWGSISNTATNVYFQDTGIWAGSSGANGVLYLFATCAGVSKVGSYTGTGTTKQVDCGFAAGARFVLIKRTDSTGDWYFWDTARGIIAGNDPYALLNSAAFEVTSTDYIDTYAAGFELSSTAPAALNASGGTYIFLAIA